ncbi:hypothetical protein GQ42DRAFT_156621 [Ramicandelaber brevisporus]|nr:hypothetical protein GQ42DRAFT_156621 [Ramicandelaber brevisporus]
MAKKKQRSTGYASDEDEYYADRKKASIKAIRTLDDVEQDSEDEFHDQRDRLMLGRHGASATGDSDDDMGYTAKNESVYNVRYADDSDDDEAGYGSDLDEEEARIDEEKEARRLQRKRATAMSEEDFIGDLADSSDMVTGEAADLAAMGVADGDVAAGGLARWVRSHQGDDYESVRQLLSTLDDPSDSMDPSAKAAVAAARTKRLMTLPVADKMRILEHESPEILHLLEEFRDGTEFLQGELIPILNKAHQYKLKPSVLPALALMQTRYQLIVTYLANILFVLSLKTHENAVLSSDMVANIKTHPAIAAILRMKKILDALSDMEQDMDSDMHGLAEAIKAAELGEKTGASGAAKSKQQKVAKTKKAQSKAADSLGEINGGFNYDDLDLPSDYDYDYDSPPPADSKSSKKAKKAKKSANGDMDMDIDSVRSVVAQLKSSKQARKSKAASGAVDDDDFAEDQFLSTVDAEDKASRRKSLRHHVAAITQSMTKSDKRNKFSGDLDLPYKEQFGAKSSSTSFTNRPINKSLGQGENADLGDSDPEDAAESRSKRKRQRGGDDDDSASDDEVDGLDIYEAQAAKTKKARASRSAAFDERREEIIRNHQPLTFDIEDGAKRHASYKILKNKGLTPQRTKEQRNPRVKHRKKYEKAMKKVKHTKRVVQEQSGAYAGEQTGIKSRLARSTRFS